MVVAGIALAARGVSKLGEPPYAPTPRYVYVMSSGEKMHMRPLRSTQLGLPTVRNQQVIGSGPIAGSRTFPNESRLRANG
jgi:hypothetical protein